MHPHFPVYEVWSSPKVCVCVNGGRAGGGGGGGAPDPQEHPCNIPWYDNNLVHKFGAGL